MIRLSAMGDVAMSVPVLKAFMQQYPDVKLTVLTRSFFTPFFADIPNVSVYSPELKEKHKGFLGIWRLAKELIKLDIHAVADLHNVLRSNTLIRFLRLKGIPYQQIDKGRADKKGLTAYKNKVFKPLQSTHERYADVFRKLGYPLTLGEVVLKNELSNKSAFLKPFLGNKIIGIAPFAAHKGKMFPTDRIKEVIEILSQEKHFTILLFGGGEEENIQLEKIATKHENVINMVGKAPFKEELNVISNLNLMLSMDSGNGHIAAMYGVPVITIWGVTHPYAGFTPFNQPESNQLLPNLEKYPIIPSSIYGNKYPDGYLSCFDTISTSTIIEKIKNALI